MMRLAFVLGEFPALSETFILNQITGLIDRNLEPDLYALVKRDKDQAHEQVLRYGLLEKVSYCPQLPQGMIPRILGGMGRFASLFPKCPKAAISAINPLAHARLATSFRLLYQVAPFFTSKRYDLIHCHFGHIGVMVARMRRMGLMPGKLVVTFYGFDVSQQPKIEPPGYYDDLFEQASRFFVLSNVMKQDLVALGCPEENIIVHHLGVDSTQFTFKPRHLAPGQTVKLLSIARLSEKKGLEYAIAALGQILKQRQDFVYNIIGEGPLRSELEAQIKALGMENHIQLLGWRTQQQVREHLDDSHLLLAPSVTAKAGDQEGTPTAIAEALMMGLPVLSTYHSGIPEMVQHQVSGYLVPERDVDALAEHLLKLMDEPHTWQTMGQAGSYYARQEFDVNRLNDRAIELYREMIQQAD